MNNRLGKKNRTSNLQGAYDECQKIQQQLQQKLLNAESGKADVENQLKALSEEHAKLNDRFKIFNDELYKQKKLNKLLIANEAQYKKQIKELENEKSVFAQKIDRLNSELNNLSDKVKNLVSICNDLVSEFNTKVVDLSNKEIMLSFNIGKAILEIKEKNGFKTLLPKILKARDTLKNKEQLKLKKKSTLNINNWLQPIDRLFNEKPNLEQLASEIPNSNGSAFFSKIPLTVAIVTDEFMFNYYNGVFKDLIYINPANYQEVLATKKIDLFMYVSCWSGMFNDDWRGIKYREKPKQAFNTILEYCKDNGIKTVFQTIEDPSNYENFLPIAKKFDYVFTSTVEKIPDYIKECGHNNVFYGEYGFNPLLNNPIGIYREVLDSVFFAGSYPQRYQERCNDMHTLFDSVIQSQGNVVIADRNYDLTDESLKFPNKYSDYVVSKIEHKLLQRVHKLFRYNANFNSIKDSETMCAMRVYELQAQGALILSNYALSVSNNHPNIKIINMLEDLSSMFKGNSDIELKEFKIRCNIIRNMYKDKSVFDQTRKMLNLCGFDLSLDKPKVLVLQDQSFDFPAQVYQYYTVKSINSNFNPSDYDYVAYVSKDQIYSKYYLEDLLNGFKYVDVDFVSKGPDIIDHHIDQNIYNYTQAYQDINITLCKVKSFDFKNFKCLSNKGFIVEPSNIDSYPLIQEKSNYDLSIIIPVYNNGVFLRDRCLKSLQLDENFDKFEILVIDDGSNDPTTISILNDLVDQYKNIKLYKFSVGGSGSASRARNKGIDIASSRLITFLDPDNEISLNGYTSLLNIYREYKQKYPNIDFITGYQNKINVSNIVRTAFHTEKVASYMKDPKSHLLAKKYPIISTQAFVCEVELLRDNKIHFALNAVGQDTLFGHEIMGFSKGAIFTGTVFINYYAERKGSVTNTLDINFFKKSLTLEKYQVESLRKIGLFDDYKSEKFNSFYENWYLEKLKLVHPNDVHTAQVILDQIKSLYYMGDI